MQLPTPACCVGVEGALLSGCEGARGAVSARVKGKGMGGGEYKEEVCEWMSATVKGGEGYMWKEGLSAAVMNARRQGNVSPCVYMCAKTYTHTRTHTHLGMQGRG